MVTRSLLTDFYELTMAAGYFAEGKADDSAVFDLYYRRNPFNGGYAVAAGLEDAARSVIDARFTEEDTGYLRAQKSSSGRPVFPEGFLDYLAGYRFGGSIWAVPEGTVVFPNEPLLRAHGRLLDCQLIETIVLCHINFQTLVATKAARMWEASGRGSIIEFGLRRAQGPDGALSACRAAFIGGADSTSNVMGAALLDIPARGTHAHSWVQAFPSEIEAFRAFARSYPEDCVLLVDTYDTLESGIPNAIRIARELERDGRRLLGVRIDSGDLAFLSQRARAMLDEAGLGYVKIVASSEVDEYVISEVIDQGGKVDVWGVGTRLVTGSGPAGCALGGIYKIVEHNGRPKIKLSANPEKVTNPGFKKVVRFYERDGQMEADALAAEGEDLRNGEVLIIDPTNPMRRKKLHSKKRDPLLECIVADGEVRYRWPSLKEIRARRTDQLSALHSSYRRLYQPQEYKVGMTMSLWKQKEQMYDESMK